MYINAFFDQEIPTVRTRLLKLPVYCVAMCIFKHFRLTAKHSGIVMIVVVCEMLEKSGRFILKNNFFSVLKSKSKKIKL